MIKECDNNIGIKRRVLVGVLITLEQSIGFVLIYIIYLNY